MAAVMTLGLSVAWGCGMPPSAASSLGERPADEAPDPTGGDGNPTKPTVLPPLAVVAARPSELTFFGGAEALAVTEPQTVTITNGTTSTVGLVAIWIGDALELKRTPGSDAEFFSVSGDAGIAALAPSERLPLQVRFTPSAQFRRAVLVVETTHPAYRAIFVPLSGKVFIGW
jgi:hypothetical protein